MNLLVKRTSLIVSFICCVFLLSACSGISDMAKNGDMDSMAAFQSKLSSVAKEAAADPSYKEIPLNTTADKNWFTDLAYKYYKKDITGGEFVKQGVAKFPEYGDSFQYLANALL